MTPILHTLFLTGISTVFSILKLGIPVSICAAILVRKKRNIKELVEFVPYSIKEHIFFGNYQPTFGGDLLGEFPDRNNLSPLKFKEEKFDDFSLDSEIEMIKIKNNPLVPKSSYPKELFPTPYKDACYMWNGISMIEMDEYILKNQKWFELKEGYPCFTPNEKAIRAHIGRYWLILDLKDFTNVFSFSGLRRDISDILKSMKTHSFLDKNTKFFPVNENGDKIDLETAYKSVEKISNKNNSVVYPLPKLEWKSLDTLSTDKNKIDLLDYRYNQFVHFFHEEEGNYYCLDTKSLNAHSCSISSLFLLEQFKIYKNSFTHYAETKRTYCGVYKG